MNATTTLEQLLNKGKKFVIPNYQRGYVWGKNRGKGEVDSVSHLLDCLLKRFSSSASPETFLQGITANENDVRIVLIDGQQRITFFYFLLKYLGCPKAFSLEYEVRSESNTFLNQNQPNTWSSITENEGDEFQDIHFFKKTIRIIREKFTDLDSKSEFLQYVLGKVRFMYVNIPDEDEARRVFTMMNGNKAQMLPEEVIKAELLRLASLNTFETGSIDWRDAFAREWECNAIRSRYAREWDKWLYWWNREDVKSFYMCDNPMGLLISSYIAMSNGKSVSLEAFKQQCLKNGSQEDSETAFYGLRNLQKSFEDAFINPVVHNSIGFILKLFEENERKAFIKRYFIEKKKKDLKIYSKLALLGFTPKQCATFLDSNNDKNDVEDDGDVFSRKYQEALKALTDDDLYHSCLAGGGSIKKQFPVRWLTKLNIDEDTKQNRFFNFKIWDDPSLEHICPQSKVGHKNENGQWVNGKNDPSAEDTFLLFRDNIAKCGGGTEHSIGNIVLLYKNENSAFGPKSFVEKKEMFFDPRESCKSRHLLHTVCVFAGKNEWNEVAIAENRKTIIKGFEDAYKSMSVEETT